MLIRNEKTKRILYLGIVSFLAIVISFIIFTLYNNSKPVILNTKRIFSPLKEISTIDLNFEPSLTSLLPTGFFIKANGIQEASLIDFDGVLVKKFISPYIEKKHAAIVSLGKIDSLYYMADGNNATIFRKSINAKKFDTIKTNFNFSKVVVNEDYFLIQYTGLGKFENKLRFAKVTFRNGKVSSQNLNELNDLYDKIDYSGMLNSGSFISNGNVNFYVGSMNNNILAFNKMGKILFNKEAVYSVIKPEIIIDKNSMSVGHSVITTTSLSVNQDYLYILSNISDKRYKGKRVIDAYSTKDGSYIKSYVAPSQENKLATGIETDSKFLYLIYNDCIKKFITL